MPPMYAILWNSQAIISLVIPHADPEMVRRAALYVKVSSFGIPVGPTFSIVNLYRAEAE